MSKPPVYRPWLPATLSNLLDKETAHRHYIEYMLNRTQSMFEYSGLPDTIPHRFLELYLQCNGHTAIAEHNGKLYALFGGWGGEPDAYYVPTRYVVSNPHLNFNKELKIGEDCVLMRNDALTSGLLPLFSRYAIQLVENDISIRSAQINSRLQTMISAQDDRTADSAKALLKGIEDGKLGVALEPAIMEGLKVHNATNANSNVITQLIELHQYLKASWYNDIGVAASYNMKREALNSSETSTGDPALLPLVDEMLRARKEGVKEVNEMFGTNISVKLNSAWKLKAKEMEAGINPANSSQLEKEVDTNEPPSENE